MIKIPEQNKKQNKKKDIKQNKKQNKKKDIKQNKKQKELKEKISHQKQIYDSLKTNYLSWLVIIISIILLSPNNILKGFITFFTMMLTAYVLHFEGHQPTNLFNILHHYHHEYDNLFAYFSQIFLELNFFSVTYFINYFLQYVYNTVMFDEWVVIFSIIFYSSIHSINYGILRVNDVHSLHHSNVKTNIGPDICDVIFKTKNKHNKSVENTNHYIPNIIIVLLLTLFFKKRYVKHFNKYIFYIFSFFFIFCFLSSLYLYIYFRDIL